MKARLPGIFLGISAIAILWMAWPPFVVAGEIVMVHAPVPLWIRLTVALFGKAYIFEARWEFFAALFGEIMALALWLGWRRVNKA